MVMERMHSRKVRNMNELKDTVRIVVSSIPREMCVRALNGTVARWFLCVERDGERTETVL